MIRCITPRFGRNPCWTIRIVVHPVTLLIGRPTICYTWPPCVTVPAHVLPITVVIEIVEAGYPRRCVLVAHIATIRIIVIGILEVRVVVYVAPVVIVRIL